MNVFVLIVGAGDYGAGCLSVALPALRKLEILDLEGSGITQYGGEVC